MYILAVGFTNPPLRKVSRYHAAHYSAPRKDTSRPLEACASSFFPTACNGFLATFLATWRERTDNATLNLSI